MNACLSNKIITYIKVSHFAKFCAYFIFIITIYQGAALRKAWQYLLSIRKLLSDYDTIDRNMVEINYKVFKYQRAYRDDTTLYVNKN